jgi:hypothetical protein
LGRQVFAQPETRQQGQSEPEPGENFPGIHGVPVCDCK